MYLDDYKNASTKFDKSIIVTNIVRAVKRYGGDFVRINQTTGLGKQVSNRMAREKVGQGLRDALHTFYKSSSKAKNSKRRREQRAANEEEDYLVMILAGNGKISSILNALESEINHDTPDEITLQKCTAANIKILNELKRIHQANVEDSLSLFQNQQTKEEPMSIDNLISHIIP